MADFFRRVEKKYILTREQYLFFKEAIRENMIEDEHGKITVDATGDGLDANGSININGGNVIVIGPTSGGNGALDYDSGCTITGGDIIIYGSTGMWQNPTNSSTQICLTLQTSGSSGDEITLKDSSGNTIKSFTTEKSNGAILISNADIQKGETYTLYKNNTSMGSIQANNVINSSNSGNKYNSPNKNKNFR